MGWVISPTEPPALRALGLVNMSPEAFGCDFLHNTLRIGCQRKEVSDLISSANGDRLAVQIQKMRHSAIAHRFLIIEGRFKFTADGSYIGYHKQRFSKKMLQGLLMSIQAAGVTVLWSDDIADTAATLGMIEAWVAKPVHTFLTTRSKAEVPSDEWGQRGNREWAVFLVSSWPGFNRVLAGRVVDRFGEGVIQWQVTAEELMEVEGVSKGKVAKVMPWLKPSVNGATTPSRKSATTRRAGTAAGSSKRARKSSGSKTSRGTK